jgi:HAE1 family hydrophobic/amphiphilic exporter-1
MQYLCYTIFRKNRITFREGIVLIKFSVKKPFTVFVLIAVVFIFGYGGFKNMKPDLLPSMDLPYVIVITAYPGASPEKVETAVTKPLERTMASLENLEHISSESSDNVSVIFLEFSDNANLEATTVDILEKADQVEGTFDDMIGTPLILKMNPNMLPIMVAAVDREGMQTAELSRFVKDELQVKLEGIEGVATLRTSGLVDEQVNAVLKDDKIAAANERVAYAVRSEFGKNRKELADGKAELETKLSDLKQASTDLANGVQEFASKISSGQTELDANKSKLEQGRTLLSLELAAAQELLQTLIEQQQNLQEIIDAAGGAGSSPAEEAELAVILGAIDQIQTNTTDWQTQLAALEAGAAKLAEAQAQLNGATISTQYDMASGAAQIAAAQATLTAAQVQIESGLEQMDEARDKALEQADLNDIITLETLSQVLYAQNFSMPAGYVHEGGTDWLVRVGDDLDSLEYLSASALLDFGIDGLEPICLGDVAEVFITDNLDQLYAKIDGKDGVTLTFNKQSDYSTAEVSDNIKAKFEELAEKYPGLTFTPLMDQGDYIYVVIGSILSDLIYGAIFAIIVLFLFLRDIRPTFITLCSIPVSVIFAIVLMYFSGVTINIISLSGLSIAVGMLVDNSIVVIENIFRLRSKGFSAVKAAVTGTAQVAGAITSSTLTTICVFLPIVFIQGMTRKLFTDLALTLSFALLASLLIAMTFVPAISSGLFRNMQPKTNAGMVRFLAVYDRALVWCLKFKPIVFLVVVVLLIGSMYTVIQRGFSYMPEGDEPQLSITVTPPEGTDFNSLRDTTDEVANRILAIDGVETVGAIAGANGMMDIIGLGVLGGADDSGAESATVYVIIDEKNASGNSVKTQIKQATADLDAEVDIQSQSMMSFSGMGGSGITVDIYGETTDALFGSARMIADAARGVEGVTAVDDGIGDSTPEIHFVVDRAKAMAKGLTVAQVYAEVSKALIEERTATQVRIGSDDYDVILVQGSEADLTPEYIKNLSFKTTKRDGTTQEVKLLDIATAQEAQSPVTIDRQEQRRHLAVSVTTAEDASVTIIADRIEQALNSLTLDSDVSYEISGESSTIMNAIRELGWMLVLGIALVYLVMVAQFQSLKSPFIIMITIPLAFTGGFASLLLTGMNLSVVSLVGFVMLVGIIVNNGIVLVDYINQLRAEGAERMAAIREGGATRMRPILMTALTTILGLLMMALAVGTGSEMMQPLAVVCIGGLIYGTFMTLFVVPCFYDGFNKKALRVIDAAELVVDMDA